MEKIYKKFLNYELSIFKKHTQQDSLSTLHSLKLYLDDLYYNTDSGDFPDHRYDILKLALTKRDPNYTPPVGAKIRIGENRVKLPVWLGSATKVTCNDQKDLDRWIEKNNCKNIVVSEKLDGVSGFFSCKNGKKKLYTRGDGIIGADISHLIQYIPSINKINIDIQVRGELIIPKKIFNKKYKYDVEKENKGCGGRTYKNSRNMVSGLIGAKTVREGLEDMHFVVYEIIGDETMDKPSKQMRKIKKLGFTRAMYKIYETTNSMEILTEIHNEFKEQSIYEIDGVVIQSNVMYDRNISGNPDYIFAFKVCGEDNIATTTVTNIEWQVSKHGQIIPVVCVEPVELVGVTISRISASNASRLFEKQIGIGAIVNVTRSNEVIPYILSVEKVANEMCYPEIEHEWDKNRVHLIVVNANSDVIAKMKIKLFSSFFSKMGIKHISTATVEKMYNNGLDTLLKIIGVTKKDLMCIGGFQEKSAMRIIKNIIEGLQNVKAYDLLGASGIFGYGIGRKRVISLLTDIPDLLTAERKGLKKRILEVEGFSEIMASKVYDNIDDAIKFIDDISKYTTFQDNTRVSDSLVGKKFCFSGFRDAKLEEDISNRGGTITTSISKKTSGLIVASKSGKLSGKIDKAKKYDVPVYEKEEFLNKYI